MDVRTDMIVRAFGKDFEDAATRDERYIDAFCKKYHVEYVGATVTRETGSPELAYEFSDGLGCYTIRGLESSLSEQYCV